MPQPLTVDEALRGARALLQADKPSDAAQVCRNLLAALPDFAPALHLLAQVTYLQGNTGKAIELLRRASRSDPKAPEVHNDLANLLLMTGALEEAVTHYRKALKLRPGYAEAHRNMASALRRLGRLDDAVAALETAVSLDPNFAEAVAQLVHQSKQICEWRRLDELTGRLIDMVTSATAPVNPFVFLSLATTAGQQLRCARQWAQAYLPSPTPPAAGHMDDSGKITIGYLSADFQEHATAQLIAELFLLHDRSRFRIIGYSYGKDDGSTARHRLAESLDSFVDLETASHRDAAGRIRQDGVGILVDLKGYTTDARPEITALRPAPIQVNYLGYPGTMGSEAVDYILVDRFIVPAVQQPDFSERLVHLPDCYQINDRRRPIASRIPTRAECGLPENGFVYCCLSASYKITPVMFDLWMRLLEETPGAVLWLLDSSASATRNLRREADARLAEGGSRLVFAPSLPNPEHLARLGIADLFLDTLPYNAHTVASDALWAGCPVITCAGDTFASRVAGSILLAAGLPELVTTTLDDYYSLALRLSRDRDLLSAIRTNVADNRLVSPLFDSLRLTRNIEAAYQEMWRLRQAGEAPRGFVVQPHA